MRRDEATPLDTRITDLRWRGSLGLEPGCWPWVHMILGMCWCMMWFILYLVAPLPDTGADLSRAHFSVATVCWQLFFIVAHCTHWTFAIPGPFRTLWAVIFGICSTRFLYVALFPTILPSLHLPIMLDAFVGAVAQCGYRFTLLIWVGCWLEPEWNRVTDATMASSNEPPNRYHRVIRAQSSDFSDVCRFLREAPSVRTFWLDLWGPFFLVRRPYVQWLLVLAFELYGGCLWSFAYYFPACFTFAVKLELAGVLRVQANYLLVVCIFQCFKICGKALGYAIDIGKRGSCSYYFNAELENAFTYSLFYRQLFPMLEKNMLLASGIIISHNMIEWIMGPLRASKWYFDASTRLFHLCASGGHAPSSLWRQAFGCSDISREEWPHFVLSEFYVRIVATFLGNIMYCVGFCLIRVSVNRPLFRFYGEVDDLTFKRIMILSMVSLATEVVNCGFVVAYFQRRMQMKEVGRQLVASRKFVLMMSTLTTIMACSVFAGMSTREVCRFDKRWI